MNPEAANEFVMLPQGYVVTLDVPYDYTAVMHLAGKVGIFTMTSEYITFIRKGGIFSNIISL